MSDEPLRATLAALATDIVLPAGSGTSRDVGDGDSPAALKQAFLQQRILSTYREQLEDLDPAEHVGWLIERLAGLEARVLAVQTALLTGGSARPGPEVATPEAAPVSDDPPPEPVVAAATGRPDDAALPTRALVPCGDLADATSLYSTEHDDQGRMFRWLGPDIRTRLYLPRVRGPVEVRVSVYAIYAAGSLERVRFSLDAGAWEAPRAQNDGEAIVLHCVPQPGSGYDGQVVKLDIDTGVNDSPANYGLDDARKLSFAISRVELVTVAAP